MGGGGSGPGRIGNIESLLEKARKELRDAAQPTRRNVFLSFAFEDLNYVNLLRGQARNDNVPLEFNDWSVSEPINSDRAAYIKQKIAERIAQSSVTVVFLSDHTCKSGWVDWEIRETLARGKHVIGVHPSGARPAEVPDAFKEHRLRIVGWPDLARTIEGLP